MSQKQITNHILMIRPANFGYNEETAENNAFQDRHTSLSPDEISQQAMDEFDGMVAKLRLAGVDVTVINDTDTPEKPDAIFPNNWVSFHEDGSVITYPMYSEKRRLERREDIIDEIGQRFLVNIRTHMEHHEADKKYLEGTGSMVLDRENRIVYACRAPRTDEQLLKMFCENTGYSSIVFDAKDANGNDIYHTNVVMALGLDFVVICMDSIPYGGDKRRLYESFATTNKEVVEISLEQMNRFAGNMLQVEGKDGLPFMVMSSQARSSLRATQIHQIEKHSPIIDAPLYIIEKFGGGSARCMMAEIFLPGK